MEKERRKQYTVRTAKMKDEVYRLFEELSTTGEFTSFIIQCGEQEVTRRRHLCSQSIEERILAEIQELKQEMKDIVRSGSVALNSFDTKENTAIEKESDLVITKRSSERKVSSLEKEDTDYNF